MSRLRPHPHRGDVVAAGAVPLAVAALLIDVRMRQWSLGARCVVVGLIATLIFTMGWLAELENETPRPYHSVLLVSGLVPMLAALGLFFSAVGVHGSAGRFLTFGCEAALAGAAARRANSAVCTLICAVAAGVALEALIDWAFNPQGPGTFRAILVVELLAFAGLAIGLRERRPRHAVQLVNAAGLSTLALVLSFPLVPGLNSAGPLVGEPVLGLASQASFGWKLYVLAVGFGLVAYAAVDRQPGPAYLGAAVLLGFVLMAGPQLGRGSLVGWPLFLLVIGGLGLAIGLRPRQELPPPPLTREPAPTVPLRPPDDNG